MTIVQYKQVYALEPLAGTTVLHLGGPPARTMPAVAVDNQRNTTLTQFPAGTTATDYEYQFRPVTISAERSLDTSQMLAPGESPSDYETQLR